MRVIIFLVALFLYSCSNELELDSITTNLEKESKSIISTRSSEGGVSIFQAKAVMAKMGYDTTRVADKGEYYLVDDTYRFYKDDMNDFLSKNPNYLNSRLANSGNETISAHYRKINISNVRDPWVCNGASHVATATAQWNNVGSDIQFNPDIGMSSNEDYPYNVSVEFIKAGNNKILEVSLDLDAEQGIPYKTLYFNIDHYLWAIIDNAAMTDMLVTHGLGRLLKLSEITDKETYMNQHGGDMSIMLSPSLFPADHFLWINGISSYDQSQLMNMYPVAETSNNYTFTWNDERGDEVDDFFVNENYTLTFERDTITCEDISKIIKVFDGANTLITTETTNENSVCISFPQAGNYTIKFGVTETRLDAPIHSQTLSVYVNPGFWCAEQSNIELNTPYTIQYFYDYANNPNATIEYSLLGEMMFDEGSTDNATLTSSNNTCTITLFDYGCFYIRADVKDGNSIIESHYCSVVKMNKPSAVSMSYKQPDEVQRVALVSFPINAHVYDCTLNIQANNPMGRFMCQIETEADHQISVFEAPYPVHKDRTVTNDVLSLIVNSTDFAHTYYLPRAGYWFTSYVDDLNFEGYNYSYTGKIYMPKDGIKEVVSTSTSNLKKSVYQVPNFGTLIPC